ncbi:MULTISPECIES: nucleoside phosphorylase [Salinibaculum]|uniref:nucleoside phosphorylase n=1 Tax=Salinibaculum TaxID=2732368 RepID=UPI0030D607FA
MSGDAGDAPDGAGAEDPREDEQYHLEVASGDVADSVLLPGDPERVPKVTDEWDDAAVVAEHREYRTATGTYDDTPISVTSTGIGSPSAAIAVEELARVGADTFLRVGSCGAIQEETDIGDLIITSGAVRQEGTSSEYVREDYPAVADHAVVAALAAAAEELGYDYHVGLTASTDSFYAGQSREGFEGFRARGATEDIEELKAAGVLNFEMEASAILTLANVYGLRAGAVCTVYADRTTGEFRVEGERRAARTASLAVAKLAAMDERVDETGADAWHAGLGI